jgi:hypothetical protein
MPADAESSQPTTASAGLPTLQALDQLVDLVAARSDLYVRWSRGPDIDLTTTSKDELTGADLPGLCAHPLQVQPWWSPRPDGVWIARRLYDYRHLAREAGVAPWVLQGEEVSRGPDDEPIVRCVRPIALLAPELVDEAEATVHAYSDDWGPLDRRTM